MTRINKSFWLLVSTLIVVDVIFLLPEAIKERIFPYDGALFAANGAFFLSVFKGLSNVISSPANLMWD